MLGSAKVTIKEIQDALWYYYFDIDQAAVYLLGNFFHSHSLLSLTTPLFFFFALECEHRLTSIFLNLR